MLDIRIDSKSYGDQQVLGPLQLQLKQGEVVSLLGASGSGKSTLLSILAGLDREWRGSLQLNGAPLQGVHPAISLVFQEPRLFPWLTVAENLRFGLPSADDCGCELELLLAETGLQGLGRRLPKQLSGGQAQRAAIARGLMRRPRLLLLDEPFSAVDAFTRMKLQDLLLRIAAHHHLTILQVTHDIDEALYLSDRILVLPGGGGPLRGEFRLPPARPRSRGDASLQPLKHRILELLNLAEQAD
ncbi:MULTISPECIES: ABC transporter ATP-binding protein [unclassified Duganella]|uniref:ABC transporter ATP-binding protein n=1 Tax=unclassified Duganella TaxID=2636909 RepID=UPI0006F48CEA|nr:MULTISPECIES: ABC transporter ATP-binding protein [unclassified Duganella]KQV61787.1 sulfonate ABC transporter ATP-binding protein [Duganella sp. Root336D2]KRB84293.1 sulfonate ABC transporter ATP-binding protein [Duganella sp. Root198D2]